MFNFLKEKLKSWISKAKPSEEKVGKLAKKEKLGKQAKSKSLQNDKVKEKVKPASKGRTRKTKAELDESQKIGTSLNNETDKELTKELYESVVSPDTKQVLEDVTEQQDAVEEIGDNEPIEEKKGFFDFFKKKMTEEKFEELFSELEMGLLQNNVALEVVEEIKKFLRERVVGKNLKEVNLQEKIKEAIEHVLLEPHDFVKEIKKTLAVKQPFVIAFVGINGSGKTTTIAKVANKLKKEKFSVCLAAADTFRAASIEQLQQHAEKLGVPIIKKEYNSDPASVGFEAIQYAKKHHIDIVLIDTAGRMNTKDSLMKEMEKIIRVCKPDMKIFIGESITGNDATEQARSFNESIDLSGIILSKADVDEKGGTALSVSYVTKKPILFLGVGQGYDDLEVFDKKKIIKNLGL